MSWARPKAVAVGLVPSNPTDHRCHGRFFLFPIVSFWLLSLYIGDLCFEPICGEDGAGTQIFSLYIILVYMHHQSVSRLVFRRSDLLVHRPAVYGMRVRECESFYMLLYPGLSFNSWGGYARMSAL